MNKKGSWGIVGMGTMGVSLSRNFASHGYKLSLYNRYVKGKEEKVALKLARKYNFFDEDLAFESLEDFVKSISKPRKLILMLPAGEAIDEILKKLKFLLKKGDIIIDGGNSEFKDTERRASFLKENEIQFIGMGISGGQKGALEGPSLMIGGDREAYETVKKDLNKIAAKDSKGNPCCNFLGSGGAGHYIKMVHNGIEYAEMQLLAEVFEILMTYFKLDFRLVQKELESWQNSSSDSYLLRITSTILSYYDSNGSSFISNILDKASNKGTGAWATISGAVIGSPNSLMTAALHARYTSSMKSKRIEFSKTSNFTKKESSISLKQLKKVYDLCRWINHHQGFDMINTACKEYNWKTDLATVAQIWSEGSIIKSKLMETLGTSFCNSSSIMKMETFQNSMNKSQKDWNSVINYSGGNLIPIPCISTSWNYFLTMTQPFSNANLIQAQRDFFGAHGFVFIDQKENSLNHGPWNK